LTFAHGLEGSRCAGDRRFGAYMYFRTVADNWAYKIVNAYGVCVSRITRGASDEAGSKTQFIILPIVMSVSGAAVSMPPKMCASR